MSGSQILALVPPEGPGVAPETELLGLPIIRRTVLAARRAGFARVFVAGPPPSVRAALEGTAAEVLPAHEAAGDGVVRLPWNVVVRTKDLQELLSGAPAAGVPVASNADLRRAEKFLLRGLIKDAEGFMSRHFDRTISLAISRRLAGTRVTPNAMTVVSVAVGLFGAFFFLSAHPRIQVIGGSLFLVHSILDGCDGELARLKFQESRWGGVLDFWGDNAVHAAVFAAMAIGLTRSTGQSWPLYCGASAVAATAASAFFVYRRTMTGPKEGPLFTSVARHDQSMISRVADALSRRDFIYLVLIMSIFGKADWFVVLAAVAVPSFFLALVAIAWRELRLSRSVS